MAAHIDLFCCGHTHGGQVRLPFYGALITNSALGKNYEAGLYYDHGTATYVSRGIGMIGLPVRFLCRPELTAIDIFPAKPTADK
jgi:predicted MPP superfamily phosphohydrolase